MTKFARAELPNKGSAVWRRSSFPGWFFTLVSLVSLVYFSQNSIRTASAQSTKITIQQRNPVVNENRQLQLNALDANGQPAAGVRWESGSPEIASVDPVTGLITGVRSGFATITARSSAASVSTFVAVARVRSSTSAQVPGDTKAGNGGAVYLSNPQENIIFRKPSLLAGVTVYAGQRNRPGRLDGPRQTAQFAGPTAVAIDSSPQGGIFIADSLNHSIRKVDYAERVTTLAGNGSPGRVTAATTPFAAAQFSAPRGLAVDAGGNLFVADTDNHAILFLDVTARQVRVVAGEPGQAGLQDGQGRTARFNRPTALELNNDGTILAVADSGNNVVRLVSLNGTVATLGRSTPTVVNGRFLPHQQPADAIRFDNPQSVRFDSLNNVYVVDQNGPVIVTRTADSGNDLVALAQTGSFAKAASVEVRGNEVLVLDANASTEADVLKIVSVGGPEITSVTPEFSPLLGERTVVVRGKSFAAESELFLGGQRLLDFKVVSATEIQASIVRQDQAGLKTLTVRTRGGLAQTAFYIEPPAADALKTGEITTMAGGTVFVGDGGFAGDATLSGPKGLALDASGHLFIADEVNHRVRSVDLETEVIVTEAGTGTFGNGTLDGTDALATNLTRPADVAVDSKGNLYTSDYQTVIRIEAQTRKITNLLSTEGLRAFTLDSKDNLLVVDVECDCIKRLDAAGGRVTTVAGTGQGGFAGDGGPPAQARFLDPTDIAVDTEDNLYIADRGNHRIRRIEADFSRISTVAGNGNGAFSGDGGSALEASLNSPTGMTVDGDGNLFIADTDNHRVRQVDFQTGIITTLAGKEGPGGFSGDEGNPLQAQLNQPVAVVVDGEANVYISDAGNNRVRVVYTGETPAENLIYTLAGQGAVDFGGEDVEGPRGRLFQPSGVAVNANGDVLVADTQIGRIRQLEHETRLLATIAGLRSGSGLGDGGPALNAFLSLPGALAVDTAGNILILDSGLCMVRRIDNSGRIERLAGIGGEFGFGGDGGPALNARFNQPLGMALDRQGNIFLADSGNHRIRRIDAKTQVTSTFAGTGQTGFGGDGGPAITARFEFPTALAFDSQGNLYCADSGNRRIRRIDIQTGVISTVAGTGKTGNGESDGDGGPATQAAFSSLMGGLAFDRDNNLFLSDTYFNRVRRIDRATGVISRIAGPGLRGSLGDGADARNAFLQAPQGLAFDAEGNLLIADSFNNAVRLVKNAGVATGNAGSVTIAGVTYQKSLLTIQGKGFTGNGAVVLVNGNDVSSFLRTQSETTLTLKGKAAKLKLVSGVNQIVVKIGSETSNSFSFSLP
ncbi:MAG: Ig-like domain-containing protein [Blastocatellia bacterium]|nr:Ig-like domain-containing protein [Blastocatellia bacterium]